MDDQNLATGLWLGIVTMTNTGEVVLRVDFEDDCWTMC